MPRYMPQHVFDLTAIASAMGTLKGKDNLADNLVETYLRHYPDEDPKVLVLDVWLAAIEVNKAVDLMMGNDDDAGARFNIMRHLAHTVEKLETSRRPLWRRALGGTQFNYEKTPLVGRVARCGAQLEMIARDTMLAVPTEYFRRPA